METSRSKRNAPNWLIVALAIAALIVLVAACGAAPAPTPPPQPTAAPAPPMPTLTADQSTAAVSFPRQILPMFQKNCVSCHGGGNPAAGLDLTSYASVMKGSKGGEVISLAPNSSGLRIGSAGHSLLYQDVSIGAMPKGGERLSEADLKVLAAWMFVGAPGD
jgi:mono/diheme cytochrome c family protein